MVKKNKKVFTCIGASGGGFIHRWKVSARNSKTRLWDLDPSGLELAQRTLQKMHIEVDVEMVS